MNKIPKLRIPEFRFPGFSEEWVEKKLEEITDKISDGYHGTPVYDDNGDFHFINGNNLINDTIVVSENTKKVNQEQFEIHKKPLNENTLLLSINGTIGNLAYYNNEKIILGKSACYINLDKKNHKGFIFYQLRTNKINDFFVSELTGTTIKNLSLATIKNTVISFPTIAEQHKIALFLTAIDEKIQTLKKKKTLLEQYKRGVMQKIFSQELQFKDENGNEYPDWEDKTFGRVFSFRSTNSYSRVNLNYCSGEVKNIHYGDIHTKFRTHFNVLNETVPFINSEIALEKIPLDNYCKEGDLIIADASEDYADIGKSIEIVILNKEKLLAGLHTLMARPDLNEISIGFSGHLMRSEKVHLQIKTIAQGTKVLSISTGRLSNIVFNLPSLPEQTKTANFLSAIDEKITLSNIQIEKTEQYKKGLLQKMFV